jgi:poly(A) polymerase
VPAETTHHTAVVLIPPEEAWHPIQVLRLRHDKHAARYMQHVTLLYGFVPDDDFREARAAVEGAVASVLPFEITLAELGTFANQRGRTVWARPEATPEGAPRVLQAALERAFRQCDEQGANCPRGSRRTCPGAARRSGP